MHRALHAAAIVLGLLLSGCALTGPTSLRVSRGDYNEAIRRTNGEQLLLNLVRLRYRDTPCWLEVASVTTSYDFTASAAGSADFPIGAPNSTGVDAGLRWSEKPTISFSPLQGEKFVRQILTPVDTETLLLLSLSGWSMERLFTVFVNEMNGVSNAKRASGPTPSEEPRFAEFREAARLLWDLQKRDGILVRAEKDPGGSGPEVILGFTAEAAGSPEARRFRELCGLAPDAAEFPLHRAVGRSADGHALRIVPRSVQGAMFFLSQGIEVPAAHEEKGWVTVTRSADGSRFDWGKTLGGVFRVHSGGSAPSSAAVAIPYRGAWFWIEDSDLSTKSTFTLLAQVLSLQGGGSSSAGPVLTLAVGQ